MNTLDELKNIKREAAEINRLLMNIRRTGGGGGSGEANTASNQGVGGVGLFNAKVGVDLQFRNINAGSSKITVTLDGANKEVDIDVVPGAIDLDDLGDVNAGAPSNNDVLAWDGGSSEWINKSLGGLGAGAMNFQAFRKSGRWYTQQYDNYGLTTGYLTIDYFYGFPFIVPVQQSFDRIGINVNAAISNGKCRLGIYDNSGVYPNSLIVDSGELDCTTTGDKIATISQTLDPDLYWLVLLSTGDSGISFRGLRYQYMMQPVIGRSGVADLIGYSGLRGAYTYGALPSTFPGGITEVDNINQPAIMLRVA